MWISIAGGVIVGLILLGVIISCIRRRRGDKEDENDYDIGSSNEKAGHAPPEESKAAPSDTAQAEGGRTPTHQVV